MEIIVWIAFGAIAGWLVSIIAETTDRRVIARDIFVGILSALVCGFAVTALSQSSYPGMNINSLLVATIGAIIILFAFKSITDEA